MTIKKSDDLNSQMINDALIIINSVGFLERQISWNLSLMEEAINNGYHEDIPALEKRIRALLDKVGCENTRMDEFMSRYSQRIKDEKETILSGIK